MKIFDLQTYRDVGLTLQVDHTLTDASVFGIKQGER